MFIVGDFADLCRTILATQWRIQKFQIYACSTVKIYEYNPPPPKYSNGGGGALDPPLLRHPRVIVTKWYISTVQPTYHRRRCLSVYSHNEEITKMEFLGNNHLSIY